MNTETMIYSVFATFLGMAVVFGFLAFLSLMMTVLKRTFKEAAASAAPVPSSEAPAPAAKKRVGGAGWLIAAVSAFLAIEEEEYFPYSAEVWKSSPADRVSPWIVGGKFVNRGIGE
jgi:Na+-transporting methylmalonyl-CoA/oxaloacetate decarboxylase gamma subunit